MSAVTKIEWCDRTWNVVRGCSLVSPGCTNCYAMKTAHRFSGPGKPYEGLTRVGQNGPTWTGDVRLIPKALDEPLRWQKPCRVFVNSMSDLFHEGLSDADIDRVFAVMALAPGHVFQVLTKRPQRMLAYLSANGKEERWWFAANDSVPRWIPPHFGGWNEGWYRDFCKHVHLGVSIENQATADERIPLLLQTPAAVRFCSYEPALGPVDFVRFLPTRRGMLITRPLGEQRLDWIIVGGESGPGARPMDLAWARSAIAQCKAAGVPVFVKQLGARPVVRGTDGVMDAHHYDAGLRDRKGGDPSEWPEDLRVREFPSR